MLLCRFSYISYFLQGKCKGDKCKGNRSSADDGRHEEELRNALEEQRSVTTLI